jgi:hypothetical protein
LVVEGATVVADGETPIGLAKSGRLKIEGRLFLDYRFDGACVTESDNPRLDVGSVGFESDPIRVVTAPRFVTELLAVSHRNFREREACNFAIPVAG